MVCISFKLRVSISQFPKQIRPCSHVGNFIAEVSLQHLEVLSIIRFGRGTPKMWGFVRVPKVCITTWTHGRKGSVPARFKHGIRGRNIHAVFTIHPCCSLQDSKIPAGLTP